MNSKKFSSSLKFVGKAAPIEDREGLPLYLSPVQAGFPSPADDYMEGKLDLHKHLVRNESATFFLRASGNSMEGAGIFDGDLLVVDRSIEATHNRIVIAALDGELTVLCSPSCSSQPPGQGNGRATACIRRGRRQGQRHGAGVACRMTLLLRAA